MPTLAFVWPGSSARVRADGVTLAPGDAVTGRALLVRSSAPVWTAAATRTATVGRPLALPV